MIIVDQALEKRHREGRPVRVAMTGAGYMARGIALQIIGKMPGLRLVAISNRSIDAAEFAYRQAGIDDLVRVHNLTDMENAVARGRHAITDDAALLAEAGGIEVLIEATGEVEFGAHVVLGALKHGKHVVLMNAELDATVGPILKRYADRSGVVISNTDGDQPGEVMNLLRFVRSIGCRPVLAGNIKGMIDPYRTPETQRQFAEAHKQQVKMITSFADGTKISMEMAVVANATGFPVGRRGMFGPRCEHANEAPGLFPEAKLLEHGLVDYLLGAEPGPGVFVLGYDENPVRQQYMNYFKMGDGPFYVFYTPYHLPHLEAPITAARAALFHDAATTPLDGPVCEVLTVAKRALRAGDVVDGIGGFACYGVLDNSAVVRRERLLPMGLAEGCRLIRDVAQDQPLTYDDVEVPRGRLCDQLRAEQEAEFG
jgi:predicted homoserine dehydrogenase-like protein